MLLFHVLILSKDSQVELYKSLKAERVRITSNTCASSLETAEDSHTEDVKGVSTKQALKCIKQRNVDALLQKCGIDNLTAIVPNTSNNCNSQRIETCNTESSSTLIAKEIGTDLSKDKKTAKTDITEASNSYGDADEEEEYVSSEVHKALKEEVTKLHERNMDYMQIIEVLKKDALQSEEHWKKKYNDVQQQNEELITKIKLLSDLNFKLQVQLNSLRKEISSLSTDTVKNITHSNPPDIDQGMMLSPFENNVEIIKLKAPRQVIVSFQLLQHKICQKCSKDLQTQMTESMMTIVQMPLLNQILCTHIHPKR
ncbi:uncharacterized protein [Temnothorax nylanderi]|uniref:uncharacterized protein n=1 Tax=Temnothorax nylanderi TaxID=102681 RepID=UPI003A850900